MTSDECLLREICRLLNRFDGRERDFLPETTEEAASAAAVTLAAGRRCVREYVDGSRLMEVPFRVRVRTAGGSPVRGLRTISLLEALADWLEKNGADEAGGNSGIRSVRRTDGPVKAAEFESGDMEFVSDFAVRLRQV